MPEGKMTWAYRAVFKQTAGGGGAVLVTVTAVEQMTVLYARVGPNDYAATRTLSSFIKDSAGNQVGVPVSSQSRDNQSTAIPAVGTGSGVTANWANEFNSRIELAQSDSITFQSATLVTNEEMTIVIRALIKTTKPTVETTGSGGTVTTTTTYDKVI